MTFRDYFRPSNISNAQNVVRQFIPTNVNHVLNGQFAGAFENNAPGN